MQCNNGLKEVSSIIWLLQLIGLLPCFKVINDVKFIYRKKWSKMYHYLIIVTYGLVQLYILILLLGESKLIRLWNTHSGVMNVNQFLEISFCVIVSSIIAFNCYMRSECQLNILRELITTGCEIRRICDANFRRDWVYNHLLTVVLAFSNVAFFFIYAAITNIWDLKNFIVYSIYWIQMILSNASLSFIGSICFAVLSRLECINSEIQRKIRNSHSCPKELISLFNLNGRLREVIYNVNSCFGLVALVSIAFNSYAITKDFFFLYVIKRSTHRPIDGIGCILWISLYAHEMISLFLKAGNLKTEVNALSWANSLPC